MNGSHSGNGTIKSENRKNKYKQYRVSGRRERNRDRGAKTVRFLVGGFGLRRQKEYAARHKES